MKEFRGGSSGNCTLCEGENERENDEEKKRDKKETFKFWGRKRAAVFEKEWLCGD